MILFIVIYIHPQSIIFTFVRYVNTFYMFFQGIQDFVLSVFREISVFLTITFFSFYILPTGFENRE